MRVGLYLLKELFKALSFKSVVLSILAVLLCFITLSIISLIASEGIHLFGRLEIAAVLKDDTPHDEINRLYLEIQSWHEVASIKYVPSQAVKSPLKSYLKIELKDPEDAESVSASLQDAQRFPQIEEVIASKLSPLSVSLQKIPQGEVVFWGVLAFLFLMTIAMIRLALGSLQKSFRGQIEILQLAGVNPGTIRLPFVFMGILYGLLGALATLLFFSLASSAKLGFRWAETTTALCIGGLGLGVIGGLFSLRLGHRTL